MKKLLFVLLLVFPVISGQSPSKHQVTFKITYNSITLEEAAEIEKQIIRNHSNACKVEVDLSSAQSGGTVLYWDGTTTGWVDSINVEPPNNTNIKASGWVVWEPEVGYELEENGRILRWNGDAWDTLSVANMTE